MSDVVHIHKQTNDGMIKMLQDMIDRVERGEINSIAMAAIMIDGGDIYCHDNDVTKKTQMIGALHRLGMHLDRS